MDFMVEKNGQPLAASQYTWDEKNKVFRTEEPGLNIFPLSRDNFFIGYTFKTGDDCTFEADFECVFETGNNCHFNVIANSEFKTGDDCHFRIDYYCIFTTGKRCIFELNELDGSEFNTLDNCKISGKLVFDTVNDGCEKDQEYYIRFSKNKGIFHTYDRLLPTKNYYIFLNKVGDYNKPQMVHNGKIYTGIGDILTIIETSYGIAEQKRVEQIFFENY